MDHVVHRNPLNGTDPSNFTTGISSNREGTCIIIGATMAVGEQGEAGAAWWCAFIIDHPEVRSTAPASHLHPAPGHTEQG